MDDGRKEGGKKKARGMCHHQRQQGEDFFWVREFHRSKRRSRARCHRIAGTGKLSVSRSKRPEAILFMRAEVLGEESKRKEGDTEGARG